MSWIKYEIGACIFLLELINLVNDLLSIFESLSMIKIDPSGYIVTCFSNSFLQLCSTDYFSSPFSATLQAMLQHVWFMAGNYFKRLNVVLNWIQINIWFFFCHAYMAIQQQSNLSMKTVYQLCFTYLAVQSLLQLCFRCRMFKYILNTR